LTQQQKSNDSELVQACLRGDTKAWQMLIEKYAALIFSIPKKIGLPHQECQDIFQDICLLLYRNLANIRAIEALPAWLATSTRRLTWRKLRLLDRLESSVVEDLIDQQESFSIDQAKITGVLLDSFSRLNPRCRIILEYLYLREPSASYQELANYLEVPINSISPWRIRCLKRLKALLETHGFMKNEMQ